MKKSALLIALVCVAAQGWAENNARVNPVYQFDGDEFYDAGTLGYVTPGRTTYIDYNQELTLTATPPTGWQVDSWWTGSSRALMTNQIASADATFTVSYAMASLFSQGIRVGPRFTLWRYTLAYANGGGTGSMESREDLGYTNDWTLAACTFARRGYDFAGWKSEEGLAFADQASVSGATLGVTKDAQTIRLTAQWTAHTYSVTLERGEGFGGSSSLTATFDSTMPAILLPTREGYEFKGYYTGRNGSGTGYYTTGLGQTTETWGSIETTLYAHWVRAESTVNAKGVLQNAFGSVYEDGQTQTIGTAITLTAKPNAGYAFEKWSDGNTESPRVVVNDGTTAYFASFTGRVYRVSFDVAGCTPSTLPARLVTYADAICPNEALPTVASNGCVMTGWACGAEKVDGETPYRWTQDITLKPLWTNAVARATAELAASALAGTGMVACDKSGSVYSGTEVTLTATPATGYSFRNWSNRATTLEQTVTVPTNGCYAAVFTGNVYTVEFQPYTNTQGVVQQPAPIQVTYGQPYGELPVLNSDTNGYFVGWKLDATPVTMISNQTLVAQAMDHTLISVWNDVGTDWSYSYAMGCSNLLWKVGDRQDKYKWVKTNYFGVSACAMRAKVDVSDSSLRMSAQIEEPGTLFLSFACEGDATDYYPFMTTDRAGSQKSVAWTKGEALKFDFSEDDTGFDFTIAAKAKSAEKDNGTMLYITNITFVASNVAPEVVFHRVTFDPGEYAYRTGGGALVQYVKAGETAILPEIAPYAGVASVAWPTDAANPVLDACEFVATHQLRNDYRITYRNLKGSATPSRQQFTCEDVFTFAPLADVDGYRFVGWSPSGITAGTFEDVTTWAQWEPQTYAIQYKLASLKGAANPNGTTYTYGEGVLLTDLDDVPGYRFGGWDVCYISGGTTGSQMISALWTPITYYIAFENEKGAANPNVGTFTVESDTVILEPLANLADDTFVRWEPATIPAGTMSNVTVRAVWQSEVEPEPVDPTPVDPTPTPVDPTPTPDPTPSTDAVEATKGVAIEPITIDGAATAKKVAVKGLPTGVKYDKKTYTITGTPKKSGVFVSTVTLTAADGTNTTETVKFIVREAGKYVLDVEYDATCGTVKGLGVYAPGKRVTLQAKAARGYVFAGWMQAGALLSQSAKYVLNMPSEDLALAAAFITVEADRQGIVADMSGLAFDAATLTQATNVTCGVTTLWTLAASALSEVTVKVSGLPSGLKYATKDVVDRKTKAVTIPKGSIYGAAKKAGTSKAKITVKTAGKTTQVFTLTIRIDALPTWSVGTFDGVTYADALGGTANGTVSLKTTAAGKITATFAVPNFPKRFTATCFDAIDAASGRLDATLTGKNGGTTVEVGATFLPEGVAGDLFEAIKTK